MVCARLAAGWQRVQSDSNLDGLGFVHRPGTVLLDENLTLNKTKSYDIMYMHRVHNRDAVFA